jgi:large subunit ribosomal protein L22
MSVKASVKGLRMSPRKVGVVASLIRGRSVADAITILDHTPRRSALPIKKLLESAKSNATRNKYIEDTLTIKSITVTPANRIKRWRPAAHGRALPYQRRNSHINVELEGKIRPSKKKTTKKEGAK